MEDDGEYLPSPSLWVSGFRFQMYYMILEETSTRKHVSRIRSEGATMFLTADLILVGDYELHEILKDDPSQVSRRASYFIEASEGGKASSRLAVPECRNYELTYPSKPALFFEHNLHFPQQLGGAKKTHCTVPHWLNVKVCNELWQRSSPVHLEAAGRCLGGENLGILATLTYKSLRVIISIYY